RPWWWIRAAPETNDGAPGHRLGSAVRALAVRGVAAGAGGAGAAPPFASGEVAVGRRRARLALRLLRQPGSLRLGRGAARTAGAPARPAARHGGGAGGGLSGRGIRAVDWRRAAARRPARALAGGRAALFGAGRSGGAVGLSLAPRHRRVARLA